MSKPSYFVYMMSNSSRMLYVGLTTDIRQILEKHRSMKMNCFRGNFSLDRLVYLEEVTDVAQAIRREAELKASSRDYKNRLLAITNPEWQCLAEMLEINN